MAGRKGRSLRACLVCSLPTKSLRLGVDACRACALFYRRSTLQNRKYVCRQGSGKCPITRDDSFMCRSCRYVKCLAVGMHLWKPRNGNKKSNVEAEPDDVDSEEDSIIDQPSSSSSEGIIAKIAREYRASFEKRRRSERSLRGSSIYENREVLTRTGEILYVSTNSFCNDTIPYRIGEVLHMTAAAFPEYAALSQADQQLMIRAFTGPFYLMEMNYLTNKYFPHGSNYVMMSPTTCYDMEQPESYWLLSKDPVEASRNLQFYNRKSFGMSQPVFRQAHFSDTEYHAALGITTWDFGHAPWIPEAIQRTGEAIKKRICEELNAYYKEVLTGEECASRLGRLHTAVHTVQEASFLLQQQYQVNKLLGVNKEEDLVVKCLL